MRFGCKNANCHTKYTLWSSYKVYETVEEGSYIKMIDMASGHGGQIQVSLLTLLVTTSKFCMPSKCTLGF